MSDRYIATEDIYAAPGVKAYNAGAEVPASAVENLNAKDKVASERTKAGVKEDAKKEDAKKA